MIDETLLGMPVCPADRGPLLLVDDPDTKLLYNPRLRRAYRIEGDIPVLLIDEAVEVSDEEHDWLIERATPATPQ
jgi:uncharacterized protein